MGTAANNGAVSNTRVAHIIHRSTYRLIADCMRVRKCLPVTLSWPVYAPDENVSDVLVAT